MRECMTRILFPVTAFLTWTKSEAKVCYPSLTDLNWTYFAFRKKDKSSCTACLLINWTKNKNASTNKLKTLLQYQYLVTILHISEFYHVLGFCSRSISVSCSCTGLIPAAGLRPMSILLSKRLYSLKQNQSATSQGPKIILSQESCYLK